MTSDRIPNAGASSEEFEFSALTQAVNYRNAIIDVFRAELAGDVIELGAGIGQMSELVARLETVRSFLAVEPDERYASRLSERLPHIAIHKGVMGTLPEDASCDVVFSINVFEHIENDLDEMVLCRKVLARKSGALCLLIPARPELYSPIDKDFGHFRRYTYSDLNAKLVRAGFHVHRLEYFSLVGYFTWLLNFRLLKARRFDPGKLAVFDRFIFPVARRLEMLLGPPPFGQSLIAVAYAGRS